MRRPLVIAVAGVAVIGGAALALIPRTPAAAQTTDGAAPSASSGTTTTPRSTREVERKTLRLTDDLDGSLGYAGADTILAGDGGTITRLPAVGSVLKRGQALYELDGRRRGIVLYGPRPVWRTLRPGISSGADIRQLEQNLQAMGLLARKRVDGTWDAYTTSAVKKFEKRQHLEVDGVLEPGDVLFVPEAVRVDEHKVDVGARVGPGTPILGGTTPRRAVTVDLAVSKLELLPVGQAVTLELPDGTTVDGTVREVGRSVDAGDDQSDFPTGESSDPTVKVTIELAATGAVKRYDAAPVTVHVVREAREDVLAVPVQALLALLEGGYAVEVVDAAGAAHLVAVQTGLYEDGWVEVRGDGLSEGQPVVVAS
jgi:peptidoglycan hydrolase-like protein with peptidoglycan-binding domain